MRDGARTGTTAALLIMTGSIIDREVSDMGIAPWSFNCREAILYDNRDDVKTRLGKK